MRDLKQLENHKLDRASIVYKDICKMYTFNDANYIDYDWIEKQMDYLNNLTDRQKHIIWIYTIYADKLINNYLRNTLTQFQIESILDITTKLNENPFKYQHYDKTGKYEIDADYMANIIEYIQQYIEEFKTIIHNSPKLDQPIKVFRGIKTDNYLIKNQNNHIIHNNEFISTSIHLESATKFMKDKCCILELTLDTSTPCIFTAHMSRCKNEFEITLAPNTLMKIITIKNKRLLDSLEYYKSSNVFLQPSKYKFTVTKVYEAEITNA